MKTIGITGQHGFVGTHLYNKLSLLKDEFTLIPFDRAFLDDQEALENWVSQCDVIVHLAAMNRHPDPQYIHDTNIRLVQTLISALESTKSKAHVLFSSSTQEERDNLYGQSKRAGRSLLKDWAIRSGGRFTGMIVPNVFGPFGKPFYNSVVATFCYQLCNGQVPAIDVDSQIKLIFVDELAGQIIGFIREENNNAEEVIAPTSEASVSEILKLLSRFKEQYFNNGAFPELTDKFSLNLFNTFRSYIDLKAYFPRMLQQHTDDRGTFVEMIRLYQGGQVSFSTTKPGITRGNHFHTRKIERFLVIKGRARIELRKYNTDEIFSFELDGSNPAYVDMPVWLTHNITNIGEDELYTVFWINEFYDPADPDTFFEKV